MAEHLGFGADFAYDSSAEVFDEIVQFSNLRTGYDLRGASYDRLRETPLPVPDSISSPVLPTAMPKGAVAQAEKKG